MKLVKQPAGSSCCGQACVAMIMQIPLKLCITLFKNKGATNYPALRKVLHVNGYDVPDRLTRVHRLSDLPRRALLVVHYEKYSHWVIKDGNKILDPECYITRLAELRISKNWYPRVTSFVKL